MINGEFVNRIVELSKGEQVNINGIPYFTRQLYEIKRPRISPLTVRSLKGLEDYLNSNVDGGDHQKLMVIVRPQKVTVVSNLIAPYMDRDTLIEAVSPDCRFSFSTAMDVEKFSIALQCHFVQTPTTTQIIKLVSNLDDTTIKTFEDDGVSQEVTVKVGVARKENVLIPNPVALAPYRTFREVEQPESKFIFRINKGSGAPLCTLHDAEGSLWEEKAVSLIVQRLKTTLPAGIAIIS